MVVLRRCVDVPDLLAAASAGQADAAVVALEAPGLDQAAVDHLRRFQVRPLAVVPAGPADEHRLRAARLGIATVVADDRLDELPAAVQAADEEADADTVVPDPLADEPPPPPGGGRVLAVWGPAGAPGRTTVAVAVAAELAARGRRTTLVDADPYGGAVAQQLGILDEVSGLLAAARLAAGGDARAAVRVGAAGGRRAPDRGHRAAAARPVGRGARRRRRAPARGRGRARRRRGRHRLQPRVRPGGRVRRRGRRATR